jgi:hypothetical protein
MWQIGLLCVAVSWPLACSGCGANNPQGRQPVVGKVTLKGAPIPCGNIRFEPQDPSNGIATGAMITGGNYAIPIDNGLPLGKYLVRINAAADTGRASTNQAPGAERSGPAIELIPPEYNTRSVQIVEVKTGRNEFNFDIADGKGAATSR